MEPPVLPGRVVEWESGVGKKRRVRENLHAVVKGCTRAGCHAKSRAAVAHIVAGTTARVERGSVGSGQVEGVWWRCRDGCCVMGGDLVQRTMLIVNPPLRKQACDSFVEFRCTRWERHRRGVGAGAVARREAGVGSGDVHLAEGVRFSLALH